MLYIIMQTEFIIHLFISVLIQQISYHFKMNSLIVIAFYQLFTLVELNVDIKLVSNIN